MIRPTTSATARTWIREKVHEQSEDRRFACGMILEMIDFTCGGARQENCVQRRHDPASSGPSSSLGRAIDTSGDGIFKSRINSTYLLFPAGGPRIPKPGPYQSSMPALRQATSDQGRRLFS
ncbi:hypothetical protein MRB53_037522 [Persea americana]|nr:hypothetical protein MRB53_037522 [Persea americana]